MNNRIVKVVLFIYFFLVSGILSAQSPVVKKSTDIVVIKGKSYYLHVVEEGQTLFAICKAYGVNIETVKQENDKHDNIISIFDVLKIPYQESTVERDAKYYYHKVEKGETLYSISRRFGVKIKRILKDNDQYVQGTLNIGDLVRLPLEEIQTIIPKEKSIAEHKTEHEAEQESGQEFVEEQTIDSDTLYLTGEGPIYATPVREEKPDFISDTFIPDNKYVKVALLLPFYAVENMNLNSLNKLQDSLGTGKTKKQILRKSEQFLYFYEGILLAVDSLKKEGYKIDLHIYDTEKNTAKMYRITEELNQLNPDLIIGPVYASEYKIIAENLMNKTIPIIYPLSSRGENFSRYPNFLQVNPSFNVLTGEMATWVAAQSEKANIISISWTGGEFNDEQIVSELTEKKLFADRINRIQAIQFYKWDFQEEQSDTFKLLLNPDQENIIILPSSKEADVSKMLPVLSAFADEFKITVLGFPEWQNFTSVDHETFFKLNVKLFAYSYVDTQSENGKRFGDTYRKYFYTEPNPLANKAYDIGLYFIPLAAKYGNRMLDAVSFYEKEGIFSRFRFFKTCEDCGRENYGFYIVNYGSDYRLKMEKYQ
ncbi:LysM peptidoglycan-binding domain-containing protein [Odoribacter lunatus]|uniref:LysM peptidoglycan-binding domain-containing protein n=1 Tax=Odoribacter lunatus TaxID=2941335 RepID=UPI002041DB68|nr:LysM peptidoglycan-binding domain-containing protein [Odoribacter lunatus]